MTSQYIPRTVYVTVGCSPAHISQDDVITVAVAYTATVYGVGMIAVYSVLGNRSLCIVSSLLHKAPNSCLRMLL